MARFVLSAQLLNNPTLAIVGAASPAVKTSNAAKVLVGNKVLTLAAQTLPALTGTIPAASSSCYAFQINAAGTISVVKGNNVATATGLSAIDLPNTDRIQAIIGVVFVDNGTASTFTGGTTALDTASLTVTYSNFVPEGL